MTTVLRRLSLVAYRGISGLVLEELTPVSLLVGTNNTGKSCILEAAGLLLRPLNPFQWVSAVCHRDVDMALVDGLWSIFPGSEALRLEDGTQQSNALVLEGSTSGGSRRVEARCVASQVLGTAEAPGLSARVEVSVNGGPALSLKFPLTDAVVHEVQTCRVFTVTPATHYSTKTLVGHLSRVVDEGRKQLAVKLLQVFEPDVEDIDVTVSLGREAIRVKYRGRGVVDLASFGDGMRRAAALALALTRASQGILLVDEIEAGIHHTVLRPVCSRLIEAAALSKVQILATTHSLEAVDAIIGSVEDRGAPDALSAFWMKRQDTKNEVRRYDFANLCTLREGALDVR